MSVLDARMPATSTVHASAGLTMSSSSSSPCVRDLFRESLVAESEGDGSGSSASSSKSMRDRLRLMATFMVQSDVGAGAERATIHNDGPALKSGGDGIAWHGRERVKGRSF